MLIESSVCFRKKSNRISTNHVSLVKKGSNNSSPYKFVLSFPDIHQEAFLPQRNVILSTFQKPTHYYVYCLK